MSESKLQTKAQKELKKAGWYVVRVIAASKKGVADLICCDPNGKFVTIEVKWGYNKLSVLQEWNADQVRKRNGIAYTIYSILELRQIISSSIHSKLS